MLRRAFTLERELRRENQAAQWLVVGKKGRSTLTFRRYEPLGAWIGFTDRPSYVDARAIANRLIELFTEGEVDRVVMVYNRYISPLTQEVEALDLLPVPTHGARRRG